MSTPEFWWPLRYGVELPPGAERSMFQVVAPYWGYYFAGLVDGEGCFYIAASKSGFGCSFHMRLRADDRPLLEKLRDEFGGIGRLREDARGGNQLPTVLWVIARRREVLWLSELLTIYPLRAKKARDFAVWQEAVDDWYAGAGRETIERHRVAITAARAFPPSVVSPRCRP